MAMSAGAIDELKNFTCPICLEIFEDPVVIPCGNDHIVCNTCIKAADEDPRCTQCRVVFDPKQVHKHRALVREMRNKHITCYGCDTNVLVINMKEHLANCDEIDRRIPYFKPVQETTQRIPNDLPNRSTFHCPYCQESNLDTKGLLKHCNEKHEVDNKHVVCPVCASMPWGEETQTSGDFIQHLNMRHKFEYDTYVDYEQDDDAMLQAAIRASMGNS